MSFASAASAPSGANPEAELPASNDPASADLAFSGIDPAIRLPDADEARCRQYSQARLFATVAEFLLVIGTLAALTLTGAARDLLDWCEASIPHGSDLWGCHLSFLLMLGLVTRVLLFPFHAYGEWVLERRFGLCRESFGSWTWEWLCRSAVFGVATVVLLLPVGETLCWWPWLILPWAGAFLLLRPLFIDHIYHPLLNVFYPVRFLRNETFNLPGIGKTTLPVFQVKVSHKTRRASASIRLRGKRTAIFVSDTLIDEFTDGEERVVMAHEFGHLYDHLHLENRTRAGVAQAHRKLIWGSAQLLAGVAALTMMHFLAPSLGLGGVHDLAGFPLLAALTLGLAQLFTPILCAEARRDERDADEYALAITGDVENYVSVMRKLRAMNLEESGAHPVSRLLWDTHPTYNERVHLASVYRLRYRRKRKPGHWRGWRNVQRHGRR